MSKIPDNIKSKYNKNAPYEWVDSQWEKFMIEQKELKAKIVELEEKSKTDDDYIGDLETDIGRLADMVTDLKSKLKGPMAEEYVYESPDDGKIIYQRRVGDTEKTLVVRGGEQMELFPFKD